MSSKLFCFQKPKIKSYEKKNELHTKNSKNTSGKLSPEKTLRQKMHVILVHIPTNLPRQKALGNI